MIGITSITYSDDFIIIKKEDKNTKVNNLRRRMTRTATLDGGCDIEDMGYTPADRTFDIRVKGMTEAEFNTLLYITKTYSLINISCREGVFQGAPDVLERDAKDGTLLRVMIKEELT